MTLHVYEDLEQGTEEWLQARCGILTASVIVNLVSSRQPTAIETDCPDCGALAAGPCIGKRSPEPLKTLHPARAAAARELDKVITADVTSETALGLLMTLAAERITGFVEPTVQSRSMERGQLDEPYARDAYATHNAKVKELGFMVREFDGYRLGYSPDGLVADKGLIEVKSRSQKIQLRTVLADEVPGENMAQLQTGLLVSGREWIDYVSYSGGMKLWTKRVHPDPVWQATILAAASKAERIISDMVSDYLEATAGMPDTERIIHFPELEITF
ncbi:YqaJ viral recombinase family protein [Paenarthrobacter sp. JL.01a]|uniref:YqaJ viral recombinase family protein n=1 Tax=Paenarthrobacter sp. JL.01a TaxID=2979324 RepID=UPI0021C797AE|nr:YqaJ viral recombinase family protein [Paenarthrobacter sp. JL.01a]UXM92537.1 YqaJ viral recombinase family protein [Paenarthrobacter sp. JL.01a]